MGPSELVHFLSFLWVGTRSEASAGGQRLPLEGRGFKIFFLVKSLVKRRKRWVMRKEAGLWGFGAS